MSESATYGGICCICCRAQIHQAALYEGCSSVTVCARTSNLRTAPRRTVRRITIRSLRQVHGNASGFLALLSFSKSLRGQYCARQEALWEPARVLGHM